MSRTARPWWREQRSVWCVTLEGRRVTLGPHPEGSPQPKYNKKKDLWNVPEAIQEAFKNAQAGKPQPVPQDTSWAILDAFLGWCEVNRPSSYDWYKKNLQKFKDGVPNATVAKLKASDIQAWLDKQTWGDNYRRGIVTAIRRAFNWAKKLEMISRNPAAGVEKPEAVHRELVVSPDQFKTILKLAKGEHFGDLVEFIWLCGCRPQEACRVEASYLNDSEKTITFPVKKSKGKKRSRVIHLTDRGYLIVKKWALRNPEGPVFRNVRGRQWTAFAIDCRFKRMKEKLGFKLSTYTLRHSYIHHGLTKGKIDPVVMATLVGHKDTTMIMRIYGHLLKDGAFMRDAARRATQA